MATTVAPPFLPPDTALTSSGFTAYQIDVATDDGALIQAIDAEIKGPLHQRWYDFDFDGVPDPTPNGPPANGRGDSHLTMITGALVGRAPTENNNVYASPVPDGAFDYGVGNYLAGAWGIPGSLQSTTARVAYLVIPSRAVLPLDIQFAVATSGGTFQFSFYFYPPEPASAVSLVLGTLIVAARNRGLRRD